MTPERLKQLRAMCEKATEEPWTQCSAPDTNNRAGVCDHFFEFIARADLVSIHSTDQCEANAALIAESRTAIPELLDEVERLQRQVVEADSWMDDAKNADRQTIGSLRAALAAMTAARDEACDIAEGGAHRSPLDHQLGVMARIAELRKVGAK